MIQYYLRIRKQHPRVKKYNSLQKLAYSSVAFLGVGSVVTGISIYWPVQFSIITAIFGGYDAAKGLAFLFHPFVCLLFLRPHFYGDNFRLVEFCFHHYRLEKNRRQ